VNPKSSKLDSLKVFQDFKKDVTAGKRYDILILCGQELHLINLARDFYIASALDQSQKDFDLCELRGADVKGRALWDELTSLPFMGQRRVVLIDSPKEIGKSDQIILTQYLERPAPSTTLIMTQSFTDKRDRPAVWYSKGAAVMEFAELSPKSRGMWIEQYAKKRGKSIQADAVSYLIETSSAQLTDLRTKLDSALLFIGDEASITIQTLMKIGGISSEYDIFRLQDAILRGNASDALKISRSLLEGGIQLLAMLGMMRGFLMKTWQIESAIHKPDAPMLIEAILGGQKFKSQEFIGAARRLGRDKLRWLVLGLLELEIHAKSKSSDTVYGFYDWIWCFSTPKSSGTRSMSLAYTG
jgi:DNA polymerase III subunit delta